MTMEMDRTFALALRTMLVEKVEIEAKRGSRLFPRGRSLLASVGVIVGVAVGGGAISYAAGVWTLPLPGSDVATRLSAPVHASGVGTQTVFLGAAPKGTNSLDLSLRCLTAGRFVFAGGVPVDCSRDDVGQRYGLTTYAVPATPATRSTIVKASPGARWQLTATYSKVTITAWGVNASGQTYGVANAHGTPDLVAVIATNGKQGYAYADELNPPSPKSPRQAIQQEHRGRTLIVYESDGTTAIGTFVIGTGSATPLGAAQATTTTPAITTPSTTTTPGTTTAPR